MVYIDFVATNTVVQTLIIILHIGVNTKGHALYPLIQKQVLVLAKIWRIMIRTQMAVLVATKLMTLDIYFVHVWHCWIRIANA